MYIYFFREKIDEWRRYWYEKSYRDTDEKFPFGFVQLAAYIDQRDHYEWPKLRHHQTHDYSYVPNEMMENVFMAVAMDTNDPEYDALHPPHKVNYYKSSIVRIDIITSLRLSNFFSHISGSIKRICRNDA